MQSVILINIATHLTLICIPLERSLKFMQYRKKYEADVRKPSFIHFLSLPFYIFSIKHGYDYRLLNKLSIFRKLKQFILFIEHNITHPIKLGYLNNF